MRTKIHRAATLAGNYDLRPLESLDLAAAKAAQVGVVRIAAGVRSPPEGLRVSAGHEIAVILKGRVRVDTADGSFEIGVHDAVVSSPAEPHATTALEDTEIFYLLVDPPPAARS